MDRKRKETLAQKRSFFVRMVSDPKIYNPAINKTQTQTPRVSSENYSPIIDGTPTIQTPTRYAINIYYFGFLFFSKHLFIFVRSASWISWPLAFLFASSTEDGGGPKSNVPIRFRHLDTTVRLSASRRNSGSSPSPENENGSISENRSPLRRSICSSPNGGTK